jgi:hypothetical protein
MTPLKKPIPPTPLTCTGVLEVVVVPFPKSPFALFPQHSTVPFESSAQVWVEPTAILRASPKANGVPLTTVNCWVCWGPTDAVGGDTAMDVGRVCAAAGKSRTKKEARDNKIEQIKLLPEIFFPICDLP